jgi:Tfp pilus assembly protein PilF
VGLGYVHLNRNDRVAARDQFQQVRAAAPGRYDGMVGLANVLALDGEYAEAAALYRQALELQPDNALTRLSLGRCLLEMGERDAGETALRAAAGGSPERVWPAIVALAATPRGRVFLRPSAAARFLGVEIG